MSLKTVPVRVVAKAPDGSPAAYASLEALLVDALGRKATVSFDGDVIVPVRVTAAADEAGSGLLALWPNERGTVPTAYQVIARMGEQEVMRITIAVPDADPTIEIPIGDLRDQANWPALDPAQQAARDAQAAALQAREDAQTTTADRIQVEQDRAVADAAQQAASQASLTATAQASLAATAAASASSVAQQDLSGVVGAALHRGPAAVVATDIYDTSKDSDGGAWVDKVDASYLYETLNGAWIPHPNVNGIQSEAVARALGGTVASTNLASAFNGTVAGWTAGNSGTLSLGTNNCLRVTNGVVAAASADFTVALIAGQVYVTYADLMIGTSSAAPFLRVSNDGRTSWNVVTLNNAGAGVFVAPTTGNYVFQFGNGNANLGFYFEVGNIHLHQVTSFAPSGSYFQNATDGKFYRLWKNLMANSSDVTAGFRKTNVTVTADAIAAPDGTNTADLVANTGAGTWGFDNYPQDYGYNAQMQETYSLHYKPVAGVGTVRIMILTGRYVDFDTATWAVTNVGGVSGAVTQLANGWVRLEATAQKANPFWYWIVTFNPVTNAAGSAYVWGQQLELGSVATTYEAKGAEGSQSETFRGNKARHPKVATRVLEAGRLVIYDALEPGRPMWAVLKPSSGVNANAWLGAGVGVVSSSIAGREGIMCIGTTAQGLRIIDFARDRAEYRVASGSAYLLGNFAQRNADFATTGGAGPAGIASSTVNGVAMLTAPGAPVDPVTGLQTPTILIAGAGDSIIKHDGSVVTSFAMGTSTRVDALPGIAIFGGNNTNHYFVLDPANASAGFGVAKPQGSAPVFNSAQSGPLVAAMRSLLGKMYQGVPFFELMKSNELSYGACLGAKIADTYNTGWMVGDVRRCLMADVSAGAVTGGSLSDRSYKNKPATIFGTLTKTLVGGVAMYSGFSAANYVQEAYSADLDPGTGSLFVPFWFTIPTNVAAAGWAFERGAAAGAFFKAGHDSTGKLTVSLSDGTTTRTATSTAAYNTGLPTLGALLYETSGTVSIIVNGKRVASTTGAPLGSLSNAAATLTGGIDRALTAPWAGALALAKPGMTAPSDDALDFICQQERAMFRDGAQVTLPDSSALVDMDYDPAIGRWRVASAANESEFVGLVRTASTPVSAGSINKITGKRGIKLVARTGVNPGVDITMPPQNLKEELRRAEEAARAAAMAPRTFDFDATAGQTDFPLQPGWEAIEVIAARSSQREGATKDWQRKFDGFRETPSTNTGQPAGTWVQVIARRTP